MKNKRILVIDDVKINRTITCNLLKRKYLITEASNGKEALDILEKEYMFIDLIILDIVMPVMNGIDFLKEKKENLNYANIPVIVITANEYSADQEEVLSLGATDFIISPVSPVILLQKVKNYISLVSQSRYLNFIEIDPLTKLYNQTTFINRSNYKLKNNLLTKYDVVYIDIINFNLYNEAYGFENGNNLLISVAKQIKKNFFSYEAIVGKMDNDHYCIFTSEINFEEYQEIYDDITKKINIGSDIDKHIRLSMGIYKIENNTLEFEQMLKKARIACNYAKKEHQKVVLYNKKFHYELAFQEKVVNNMYEGLENKEFVVFYQPKYNLKTDTISSAEALVRWEMPDEDVLVPPNRFIPILENNGFIYDLDMYVLEKVCSDIKDMHDINMTTIPISVNLSRKDFENDNLISNILDILKKYDIHNNSVYFELTESAFQDNSERIIEFLTKLKKLGFKTELDDFGSGYTSINMLDLLPIDAIKLDLKFLNKKNGFRNYNTLIYTINLAKYLGLKTVAEGVENEEQVRLLKNNNCDIAQGYYYSKPVPFEILKYIMVNQKSKKITDFKYENVFNVNDITNPVSTFSKMINLDIFPCLIAIINVKTKNIYSYRVNGEFKRILLNTLGDLQDVFDDKTKHLIIDKIMETKCNVSTSISNIKVENNYVEVRFINLYKSDLEIYSLLNIYAKTIEID